MRFGSLVAVVCIVVFASVTWSGIQPAAADCVDAGTTREAMAYLISHGMAGFDSWTPPATPTFADVPTSHWAYKEIEFAYAYAIVHGYDDGSYRPDNPVTRDQMAVYLARAIAGGDANVPNGPGTPTFADVSIDFWAYKYVEYIADQIGAANIQWSPGLFYPQELMTNNTAAQWIQLGIGASGDPCGIPGAVTIEPEHPEGWPEIVFTKQYVSTLQLYGVMADGSGLDRLHPWPEGLYCTHPVWSPDRQSVAYRSASRLNGEPDGIYCLDVGTGQERLIVSDPDSLLDPTQWSPDGTKLLFIRGMPVWGEVWRVDSDGGNPLLLAGPSQTIGNFAADPHWAGDGSRVFFLSDRDAPGDPTSLHIWAMNSDGSGHTKLTTGTGPFSSPRPSPDADRIAYVHGGDIYVMNPDGSGVIQLTNTIEIESLPRDPWSPDAMTIMFTRGESGSGSQLCLMDRDGGNQRTVLGPNPEWGDDWSPDGTCIVWGNSEMLLGVLQSDLSTYNTFNITGCTQAAWRASGIRRVYLPRMTAEAGSSVTIPVNFDTCLGVAGFQAQVDFDPAVLQCTGVVKGSLLPGSWAMMAAPVINNTAGYVRFLAMDGGLAPLPAGHGEMFLLSFTVSSSAPPGATSPLHFAQCLISDENGESILMTPVDGAVSTPTLDYQLSVSGANGHIEVNGDYQSLPYSGTFPSGSEVSLRAMPDSGYQFTQWSGDISTTDNPTSIIMDSPKSIAVEFATQGCTLTIQGFGGRVAVNGVEHSLPWTGEVPCWEWVTLTALPDPGYQFRCWDGPSFYDCGNPTSVYVSGGVTVNVSFQLAPYTLSLNKTGEGYVMVDGSGYGLPAIVELPPLSMPSLEAVPEDEHWVFNNWSGDLIGSQNPQALLMDAPKSVTAHFLEHRLVLSLSADPTVVWSAGQSQLSAQASDNLAHSMSMYWQDMIALDPYQLASLDGGVPYDIEVRGDYAYCAAGGGLTIYDISSDTPQRVAECDLPGSAVRLALSPDGDFAYVANHDEGLRVVSVADAAAPEALGACPELDRVEAVMTHSDYLYAWGYGSDGDKLRIYSLATPAAPVLLNEVSAPGAWLGGMAMYGEFLYLAGNQLLAFAMYEPSEPVLTGWADVRSQCIAVYGMYGYAGYEELQVLDLSNPSSPVVTATVPVSGQIYQLSVSGDYLYAADYRAGLRVFDISDPGQPIEVGRPPSPASALAVEASAGRVYVGGAKGLSVFGTSSPTEPVEIGSDFTFGSTADVVSAGRYAYVAAMGEGLRIVDLESPGGPSLVGSVSVPDRCLRSIAVSGQYVYGGTGDGQTGGLAVFDVSNPTLPQLVSTLQMYEPDMYCPPEVAVYGHYVVAVLGMCGGQLLTIDVADPAHPSLAGACAVRADPNSHIALLGHVAYISQGGCYNQHGFELVDIADPLNPVMIGERDLPPSSGRGSSVATAGNIGLFTRGSAVQLWYLADPANPTPLGATNIDPAANVGSSAISGNRAYLAVGSSYSSGVPNSLQVLDITDPELPTTLAVFEGAGNDYYDWVGWTSSVAVHDDGLLFGDSGWGLTIFDLGDALDQPLGSFSPSQFVANPIYTAPENNTDQDLQIMLQCTATCDVDPRLSETASTILTVQPCATMGAVGASGAPGATARVPVVMDLRSLQADRFGFSAQITPQAGAPAIGGALGFEAAAGLPTPGLVAPSGNNVSVAWLSPLAQPVIGSVYLGDILIPLDASLELGDAYEVCMSNVGASLGQEEICTEAGDCATLTGCGRLLAGDASPVGTDLNSDGDSCDFGEFGNNDITWGDVITVFDAWAIPGSFPCGAGSWRHYALDSYPRDSQGTPGGDGKISWGDIITTFDRFANPGLPRYWRPACDPVAPMVAENASETMSASHVAASAAPMLSIAGGSGEPGAIVRLPVRLDLAGKQADRAAFAVSITAVGASGSAQITGFEAAAGLPQPMVASNAGGLGVAWMSPLPSALSGGAALGDLLVTLPAGATAGASWTVHLTAVGASLGDEELDPAVGAGGDAVVTAQALAPHDVAVKLQAPSKAKVGETKRLTIDVENHTKTAESITVRLLKGGQVVQSWNLALAGKERKRLQADCTFTEQDRPSVELKAEAVLAGDTKPQDNQSTATVSVR